MKIISIAAAVLLVASSALAASTPFALPRASTPYATRADRAKVSATIAPLSKVGHRATKPEAARPAPYTRGSPYIAITNPAGQL
jgi:hypothetical protein